MEAGGRAEAVRMEGGWNRTGRIEGLFQGWNGLGDYGCRS